MLVLCKMGCQLLGVVIEGEQDGLYFIISQPDLKGHGNVGVKGGADVEGGVRVGGGGRGDEAQGAGSALKMFLYTAATGARAITVVTGIVVFFR